MKGPALGPELFVEAVITAYTTFLLREIINGPVGERIRNPQPPASGRRAFRPCKVLIAAALPPLVEDEVLPRIPEKYVERLEEEHQKAMLRSSDSASGKAWSKKGSPVMKGISRLGDVEAGLSTLTVTDESSSSQSSSSSLSRTSSIFDAHPMESSSTSLLTTSSDVTMTKTGKTSIATLLAHDPPLCTLAVRIRMTNLYNAGLASFCAEHPDILGFVDISPDMQPVNRATWACPVDPTNIHPLWEPTLPLWLKALAELGVPTEGFHLTEDAEETLKAYEVDKKRRTEKKESAWAVEGTLLRDELRERFGWLRVSIV